MAIYVHIGLPKTATTFWQHDVFRKITDVTLVHRSGGPEARSFLKELVRDVHAPAARRSPAVRRALDACLRAGAERHDLLISNENLSVTSRGVWTGRGATPAQVADLLHDAARRARAARVGVILGTRRPDAWIASRYAESSKAFEEFCQGDFERRIARLLEQDRLDGPEQWLDQPAAMAVFRDRFGPENTHFPAMEALEADPGAAILAMGRFLGGRDFAGIVSELAAGPGRATRRNSLGNADGTWRLRSTGAQLRFPTDLRAAFRRRFAPPEA